MHVHIKYDAEINMLTSSAPTKTTTTKLSRSITPLVLVSKWCVYSTVFTLNLSLSEKNQYRRFYESTVDTFIQSGQKNDMDNC